MSLPPLPPLRRPGEDPLIGTTMGDGRYRIDSLLGRGGMGRVYRGVQLRLRRPAAIKVIDLDGVSEMRAVRFVREAHLAARITHQNVVTVFDAGESDGMAWLAMEFVEGESLADLLRRDEPATLAEVASIVTQISDGLDAAHAERIVHRDLKPANILLTRTPRGEIRAKVADFGIARAIGDETQSITSDGHIVGTPEYMSPEQWVSTEPTTASDTYSLALIACRLLTGELPPLGAGATRDPRVVATKFGWSAALTDVFIRALAIVPSDRHTSPGAFAADLSTALGVEPELLRRATPIQSQTPNEPQPTVLLEPPATPTRRTRPTWALAGVTGIVAVGAAVMAMRSTPGSAPTRGPAMSPISAAIDSVRVPDTDTTTRIATDRREVAASRKTQGPGTAAVAPESLVADSLAARTGNRPASTTRDATARITQLQELTTNEAFEAGSAPEAQRIGRSLLRDSLSPTERGTVIHRLALAYVESDNVDAACELMRGASAAIRARRDVALLLERLCRDP